MSNHPEVGEDKVRQVVHPHNQGHPRRKKRNAAPVLGLWLFLLFLAILSGYYFLNSAFFALQQIEVRGNNAVSKETIVEQSGLAPGVNLFKIDTKAVSNKIQMLPSVKKVEVKRRLPSTLLLQITERTPIALVVSPDGFLQIDDEGVYIKKVQDFKDLHLPVVSGVPLENNLGPGSRLSKPGLSAALRLIQMMDKVLKENVTEIIAPSPQTITLKTLQGVEIRFGEPEEMERKVKIIEELLLQNGAIINNQTVEYIDLRYNTAPVIKRKK
jgi:cell division protein FtsQ